jgi:hypothetical protein
LHEISVLSVFLLRLILVLQNFLPFLSKKPDRSGKKLCGILLRKTALSGFPCLAHFVGSVAEQALSGSIPLATPLRS